MPQKIPGVWGQSPQDRTPKGTAGPPFFGSGHEAPKKIPLLTQRRCPYGTINHDPPLYP
jgi:hypothetical protein